MTTATPAGAAPTAPVKDDQAASSTFDVEEFVACARYGDLDGLKELVDNYLTATGATSPTTTATPTPANLTPRALYASRLPNGATALHMAAANGEIEIVKHLLPALTVGDVNAVNDDGSTALHWAALNGKVDVVKILLDAGADATLQNESGRSAVTVAEQQGHMDAVNILLKSFEPEEENEEAGSSANAEETEGASTDAGR